jgi:hypothetical protein
MLRPKVKYRKSFLVSYYFKEEDGNVGLGSHTFEVTTRSKKVCLIDADSAKETILKETGFKECVILSISQIGDKIG